jgi:hypothetical protein
MALASLRGAPCPLATIGRTTLSLVELPEVIAPARGGWAVVLEATPGSAHASCDLYRIAEGARLDGAGIVRALVLASDRRAPDAVPPAWSRVPAPPFAPSEDGAPGALPIEAGGLRIEERSPRLVAITAGTHTIEVPRYWLARMLFRIGLHGLRLGYVETYGGFFVDDGGGGDAPVLFGIHAGVERHSVSVARDEALAFVERLYRAIAPPGYVERPG